MLALIPTGKRERTSARSTELMSLIERQHINFAAVCIARVEHDIAQMGTIFLCRDVNAGRGSRSQTEPFLGRTVAAIATAIAIKCSLQLAPVLADLIHRRFASGSGFILGVFHFASDQREAIGERGLYRLT